MDACRLVVFHDNHFDIVKDETASDETPDGHLTYQGEVVESLGIYSVESALSGETEERHKVAVEQPGNGTVIDIPDGYDPNPQALTHLVQSLTDRHVATDHITGVGSADNPQFAARLAALLGVEAVDVTGADQ
jgi:hypothetical protein